jgi:MarR family transcriptional regulator, negative regulator of the multidrug operon emrRAB
MLHAYFMRCLTLFLPRIHRGDMSIARTTNLLGALALGLSDEITDAAERQVTHAGCTPGALSLIGHEPGLSIDYLARILSMSHPGAVRLVDRLEGDGLVARRPTSDGRAVALHLTTSGQNRRAKLLVDRRAVLDRALAHLARDERAQLGILLEKLLLAIKRDTRHAYAICRLCEESVCKPCPMVEH